MNKVKAIVQLIESATSSVELHDARLMVNNYLNQLRDEDQIQKRNEFNYLLTNKERTLRAQGIIK
jgi:hypothetical protein